jgi:hypothetical protein
MARDVLTPVLAKPATRKGGLLSRGFKFRKQILPEREITYTDSEGKQRQINFDREYNTRVIESFNSKAFDAVPFVLAKDDNSHSMDPEQFRGKIERVGEAIDGEEPGVYAELSFPSKRAAQAVLDNPELGVSVRIKEDYTRSDGEHFDAALVHVCGTMDPQINGMKPWERVDLSGYTPESDTIDLTSVNWKGTKMPKRNHTAEDEVDLSGVATDDLTDEQLDAILAQFAEEVDNELDSDDEDDDSDDEDEIGDEEDPGDGATAEAAPAELSSRAQKMIDLANTRASNAEQRANRALAAAADKDWAVESKEYARAGVPKVIVDLAEPYLHTVDPKMIDLSNGKSLDGSAQMRKILDTLKGLIDASGVQRGFGEVPSDNEQEQAKDQAALDTWEEQYPSK